MEELDGCIKGLELLIKGMQKELRFFKRHRKLGFNPSKYLRKFIELQISYEDLIYHNIDELPDNIRDGFAKRYRHILDVYSVLLGE